MTLTESVIAAIMARTKATSGRAIFVDEVVLGKLLEPLVSALETADREAVRHYQEVQRLRATLTAIMDTDTENADIARGLAADALARKEP